MKVKLEGSESPGTAKQKVKSEPGQDSGWAIDSSPGVVTGKRKVLGLKKEDVKLESPSAKITGAGSSGEEGREVSAARKRPCRATAFSEDELCQCAPPFAALESIPHFWMLWDQGDTKAGLRPVKEFAAINLCRSWHKQRFEVWQSAAVNIHELAAMQDKSPSVIAASLEGTRIATKQSVEVYLMEHLPNACEIEYNW